MIDVRLLGIDGVLEIRPARFGDERGFFSETWNAKDMAQAGVVCTFVQDNHSYSASSGVLRGLHYQLPPVAQDKLLRVSRGSIFDVAVDVRRGSATFGKWVGLTVSAELWNQVFIPKGFAHGFVTLEQHTEVQYKVSAPYHPGLERSIRFDDPEIGIDWPLSGDRMILSAKDQAAPLLADADLGSD